MQTSSAQTTANRQNAQSSTGPRTEQGKATSSQNGLTHGLSSQFTLLAHESAADFEVLAAALQADLQPTGEHESFLVQQMIEARWRLTRINRLEAAAFDAMLDPTADPSSPEARIIAHMANRKNADLLTILQRYAATAERSYHKNYRELLHSRQVAQKMHQHAMNNFIKNTIYAPLPGQTLNGIGFASQTPAAGPQTASATTTTGIPNSPQRD